MEAGQQSGFDKPSSTELRKAGQNCNNRHQLFIVFLSWHTRWSTQHLASDHGTRIKKERESDQCCLERRKRNTRFLRFHYMLEIFGCEMKRES